MNGNIVLIPKSIVESLVAIDPVFEHAMGDTDYALRARADGYKVFVAPGVAGECNANPPPNVAFDSKHSLLEKWRHFTSRKGLPLASWFHFTKRHGGLLWFVYFVQPYARFWWRAVVSSISRHLSNRTTRPHD
jgi:GT2 family glycosyltransferase